MTFGNGVKRTEEFSWYVQLIEWFRAENQTGTAGSMRREGHRTPMRAVDGHLSGAHRSRTKFAFFSGVWRGNQYLRASFYITATWEFTGVLDLRGRRLMEACATWVQHVKKCICVWALSSETLVEQMSLDVDPSAKNWLFNMQSLLSHADFTRLGVTLWAIWSSRRKVFMRIYIRLPSLPTHLLIHSWLIYRRWSSRRLSHACMSWPGQPGGLHHGSTQVK